MKRLTISFLLLLFTMAACRPQPVLDTPEVASETLAVTPTLASTATPTSEPPITLTVCTAQLPESLFPYDGLLNPAKINILAIIYEEPFTSVNGEVLPEILAQVPTLENGGVRLEPVTVQRGQTVVDAEGDLAVFKAGLQIRPSGCRSSECAILWDGEGTVQMDRMVVAYQLRDGLAWSDGEPVTAEDSLLSFQMANAPEAPGLPWAEDRTEDYLADDPQTVVWVGRPGFITDDLSRLFWNPLPEHLIDQQASWLDLASSEKLALTPSSYGPFFVAGREPGLIRLSPNPYYYEAGAGLPLLDEIVFKEIVGGGENAYQALQVGECDVLDESFGWENDLALLTTIQSDPNAKVLAEDSPAWWQLVFGISPASYDDVYNPAAGDRPDFLGDQRVRQGLAACLDREAMRAQALGAWGQIWTSFLPPGKSGISPEESLKFDPGQGITFLESAGWLDYDNDPGTPRIAVNVPGVTDGMALRLDLLIDQTAFQQAMGVIIQTSLADCGVGVNIETLPSEQLATRQDRWVLCSDASLTWRLSPGRQDRNWIAGYILTRLFPMNQINGWAPTLLDLLTWITIGLAARPGCRLQTIGALTSRMQSGFSWTISRRFPCSVCLKLLFSPLQFLITTD